MKERDDNEELVSLTNSSGFPLQFALEYQIIKSNPRGHNGRWTIVSKEHPWRNSVSGNQGNIDLVLEAGWCRLIVECKRPRGGTWIFLVPLDKSEQRSSARCIWSETGPSEPGMFGVDDFLVEPQSLQSEACVIRGHGEGDVPLLERVGSQLIQATEAIATQGFDFKNRLQMSDPYIYLPVIVTTAELQACKFDPKKVSLLDGTIPEDSRFEQIPYVRFRKSLTPNRTPIAVITDITTMRVDTERTILVVNASYLISLLCNFSIKWNFDRGIPPWDRSQNKV
jgi:hypothetical protein